MRTIFRRVFVLFFLLSSVVFSSRAQVATADYNALVDLYNALDGSNWTNNTNWLTGDPGTWQGVTVTGTRVTSLILPENELSGTMPSSFGNLTGLTFFNFQGNDIGGTVDISSMPDLGSFFLYNNTSDWTLNVNTNDGYYQYLWYIKINSSQYQGTFDIRGMQGISVLDLSENNITDFELNTGTGYYAGTLDFFMSYNNIGGDFDISTLSTLRQLYIDHNDGGDFHLVTNPSSGYYYQLGIIYVNNTDYTGTLDVRGMPELFYFYGGDNPDLDEILLNNSASYYHAINSFSFPFTGLNGTIDISNMPTLGGLDLRSCQVSGLHINSTPGYYTNFTYMDIRFGLFSGALDISNFPDLTVLYAHHNIITGIITNTSPDYYQSIQHMYLGDNEIVGDFNISSMPTLQLLSMSSERSYPGYCRLITNSTANYYTSLTELYFPQAHMEGTLDLRGMPALATVYCHTNRLTEVLHASNPATYYPNLSLVHFAINALTFEDIEWAIGVADSYGYYDQDSVSQPRVITKAEGSRLELRLNNPDPTDPVSISNIYTWYLNGSGTPYGTGYPLVIDPVTTSEAGTWRCAITNSVATDLTLHARPIYVKVIFVPTATTTPATCMTQYDATKGINYSDGTATVTYPTGGSYEYSLNQIHWQSGTTLDSLAEGYHTIWVRDGDGVIGSVTVYVAYEGPVITLDCIGNASCDGSGSAQVKFTIDRVTPSGSCTYDWELLKAGVTSPLTTGTGTFGSQVTTSISSATADDYMIRLKTTSSCNDCDDQDLRFTLYTPSLSISLHNPNNLNYTGVFYTCGLEGDLPIEVRNHTSLGGCVTSTTYIDSLFTWDEGDQEYEYSDRYTGTYDTTVFELAPGKYLIKAWLDDFNCYAAPVYFEVQETTLEVAVITHDADCSDSTGRAEAVLVSGLNPLQYYWLDNTDTLSTFATVSPLDTGSYQLHVIDARGCLRIDSFDIEGPEPLNIPVIIPDACNATATIDDLSPARGPYTFVWHYKEVTTRSYPDTAAYNLNPSNPIVYIEVSDTSDKIVFSELVTTHVTGTYTSAPKTADPDFVFRTGAYYVEVFDGRGCRVLSEIDSIEQSGSFTYSLGFRWKGVPGSPPPPPTFDQPTLPTFEGIAGVQLGFDEATSACIANNMATIKADFTALCFNSDSIEDVLVSTYTLEQHHYTLYYYDRAGRLTKTVSPEGVNRLTDKPENRDEETDYTLRSIYDYNSLGQLTSQHSSDGDSTEFIYNDAGQLRFSQNARQKNDSMYSYTKYDYLGRIVEVGESELGYGDNFTELNDSLYYNTQSFPIENNHEQTFTFYTTPAHWVSYMGVREQRLTLNRVSYSATINKTGDTTITYYSYDPHGNVEWLQNQLPGFGKTWAGYEYDLISNKVTKVSYNEYLPDRFFHRYSYDEDNRITLCETSSDGYLWDRDAEYQYYAHGPLSRYTLGQDRVQGIDYTYTIQGWLKGINSPNLKSNEDPGRDGITVTNGNTAPDEFSMTLTYYKGDFNRTGSTLSSTTGNNYFLNPTATNQNLYNGNISVWTSKIRKAAVDNADSLSGNIYRYDRLNRIKEANYFTYSNGTWNTTSNYDEHFSYDANGNILTAERNATSSMDELEYDYYPNTNRLQRVDDNVSSSAYTTDIDDQSEDSNYVYDRIGNLIEDKQENINITWNVYGKVSKVEPIEYDADKHNRRITFVYDAMGHRIAKVVNDSIYTSLGAPYYNPEYITTTYYARDAQGNILSTYERTNQEVDDTIYRADFKQKELHLYGSDRLGINRRDTLLATTYYHIAHNDEVNYRTPDQLIRFTERDSSMTSFQLQTTIIDSLDNELTFESVLQHKQINTDELLETDIVQGDTAWIGRMDRTVSMAADSTGEIQFITSGGNYWGDANTFIVLDKDNNLLEGSVGLDVDTKGQTVAFRNASSEKLYSVVNRTTDGRLNYVTIDMSLEGNGTETGGNKGEVLSKTAINPPAGKIWGRSFAVLEDRSNAPYLQSIAQRENVYVYATVWANDTATLCKITFDEEGNYSIEEQATLYSRDSLGQGQVKISPDGRQLSIYNHGKKQGFFDTYNNTEVLTLQLGSNGDVNPDELTSHPQITQAVKYGSLPMTGVEFSSDNRFVLYNQHSLVLLPHNNKNRQSWQFDPVTILVNVDTIPDMDLERTIENKYISMYAAGQKAREWTMALDGEITVAGYTLTGDTLYTGYYPKQNHIVYPNANITEVITARYVGDKEYELKDHLGNVRVVVSDEKGSEVSMGSIVGLIADTRSYSNYYAFGMTMPGRQYSSGEYRFGFNGKEKVDEAGSFDYDFGARMYDSRIGRFLTRDRYSDKYPYFSSYIFAGNSPVCAIDINGDSLYILTITNGSQRGNGMFMAMAFTRKYDIENSGHFDPSRDKVAIIVVNDISSIISMVNKTVEEYSGTFGKTVEFSMWSHGGHDGPVGSEKTSEYNLSSETGISIDENQMTLTGWSKINFNWAENANCNAYFYGCGIGDDPIEELGVEDKASFTTRASSLPNFQNVTLWGNTGLSFPSKYANVRNPSYSQVNGEFNIGTQLLGKNKVYMVGGELGDDKAFFGLGITYPMRKSKNGGGDVKEGQYGPGDKQ